jgi:hypothetical protein
MWGGRENDNKCWMYTDDTFVDKLVEMLLF